MSKVKTKLTKHSLHRETKLKTEEQSNIVISVVMPCLNEAKGVGKCVEKAMKALKEMAIKGEVIVVDNGSDDGSAKIAAQAGAKVIYEKQRGYGSAYLRGFEEAQGKYLIMGDSDDSYDFSAIAHFIEPLEKQGFDMVMGTRLKGKILPGAMPWSHRWIGNPILSGMLKLLFKTTISDSHCGMRSFTKDAYRKMQLKTIGMEFASEIVVNALRMKLKIHEIPITYYPREGESKLNGFRDAWRHVRFMLLYSPSYLFQLPGLFFIIVGLLLLAISIKPQNFFNHFWDFHTFMFGALGLILGYNLVLFDIFAKTFSIESGFVEPKYWLTFFLKHFTLEKGLILGFLAFLVGLIVESGVVISWFNSGFGPLSAVREVTIGMTAMMLGTQTMFASFLISLLQIKKK